MIFSGSNPSSPTRIIRSSVREQIRSILAQSRFPHAFQKPLHQLRRLVGHACLDPVERELRLFAPHDFEIRPRLVDPSRLSQARTVQTLRALKAGAQPRYLFRDADSLRVAAGAIMR